MNESKLVYRSIKKDEKGYYLRIEIVEENSVALLTEGQLSMLICKDISNGQLFAISPVTFESNFRVEKHAENEPKEKENKNSDELDDLMVELINTLDKVLNTPKK